MSKFKDWPLSTMTEQEVFDFVADHLIKQGRQSADHGNCQYSLEIDGVDLTCAAGCLIPDGHYTMDLEDEQWPELVARQAVPGNHTDLITSLQTIHDDQVVDGWVSSLKSLADSRGLKSDGPKWAKWMLYNDSWDEWRYDNPGEVAALRAAL